MSQKVYLGIDTSCYTTSAALLAEDGSLLAEARQILSVKPGRCGLQSLVGRRSAGGALFAAACQRRYYRFAAVRTP